MLEDAKILLGIDLADNSKDNLLVVYLNKAQAKFQNYCHRKDTPEGAQSSIVDYAIVMYNKRGSEGLSSESYSGVSQTYETGIPANILIEWDSFRKVRTV